MSHVLIIGQKFPTLTEYLSANGHTYSLLRDIAKTKYLNKRYKHTVLTDFSSPSSIMTALKQLRVRPDAVIATYENYIVTAAEIAQIYNLPSISVESAKACTDKFIMRTLFSQAPEKISPDFQVVDNEQELIDFAEAHSFPLILKPTNLAKSLLVTKSNTVDELLQNYRHSTEMLNGVYKKYAPNKTPALLVEEFLEGSIHSVDAFVDRNGKAQILPHIVDYQTGYDIGFNDNFHYSRILPSKLNDADQQSLIHCANTAINALGITSSAAHVEIIMTKQGARIVEIGARNGGYRERMHSLANGIDITGAALALKLGQRADITSTKNESCAVLELFPLNAGKFVHIEHFSELQELQSLHYVSVKAEPGQFVGKAGDGHKMCAVIILHHADPRQFAKDLEFVNQNVKVVTTV